jgi:hypothetical protein
MVLLAATRRNEALIDANVRNDSAEERISNAEMLVLVER